MSAFFYLNLYFQYNPNQSSSKLFCSYHQTDSEFTWSSKRPRITKTILKEKNKVGGLSLLNFKTYCKSRVVKTIWYWDLRHVDDTTLMAECKEELKSVWIRVKEESERAGLRLNI